MRDKASLLYEWRQLRLDLKENLDKKTLQKVNDWWRTIPCHVNGFNYDDLSTWPDVWEYISEEFYTNSGHGLGCFYTFHYAHPRKKAEVWLIMDMEYGGMYLVAYADGYILNRIGGEVHLYEDIKDDLDIMTVITPEDIDFALKKRNSQ